MRRVLEIVIGGTWRVTDVIYLSPDSRHLAVIFGCICQSKVPTRQEIGGNQ